MNEDTLYENFGNMLAYHRVERGLTRNEVADKLEISRNTYYQYEKGLRKIPLNHIMTLSNMLGFDIDEFFNSQREAPNELERKRRIWDTEFGYIDWTPEEIEELKSYARYLLLKRGEEK